MPEGQRLSKHQAVLSASKEAALTAAASSPNKTKQNPALLLRQVIALEGLVHARHARPTSVALLGFGASGTGPGCAGGMIPKAYTLTRWKIAHEEW